MNNYNSITYNNTGGDAGLVKQLGHVIFAAGELRLACIRPVVAAVTEGPTILGCAGAWGSQTLPQIPEDTNVVFEQLSRHVMPHAGKNKAFGIVALVLGLV